MLKKLKCITDREFRYVDDEQIYLYPNCDVTVWLRSCEKEIILPIRGEKSGEIPSWLNGSLLRNGPGKMQFGDSKFQHLFDSAALLHKFEIESGEVSYQCRFVNSNFYEKNQAANRIVLNSYGTKVVPDPCHSIFKRISAIFEDHSSVDNTSISIYPFGDEFYAFTECPIVQRINPDSLETTGKVNIRDHINVVNHTSHPFVMSDGSVFNLGMSMANRLPEYNVVHFPHGANMFENAEIVARIPARWSLNPSYMHTFGITDNFFIVIEQPLSISLVASLKSRLLNEPLGSAFKWFADQSTLFHVVNRSNGELKCTFKAATFFFLHVINAYESDGHIVVDICCYRDPSVLDCMYVDAMENMHKIENYANMFQSRPLRFVLPLNTMKRKSSRVFTCPMTSNVRRVGSKQYSKTSQEKCFLRWNNIDVAFDERIYSSFNENFDDNLIHLKNSTAKAYFLEDQSIFCVPEKLCDLGCETPRINEKLCLGKKYRYFYAISSDVDIENPGTLIKCDTSTKTNLQWNEPDCYPSEPIFVPSPNATTEDDGVVLSAMIWGGKEADKNCVGLLVLCAKTFVELGRCVFKTPGAVPKCLHGWFQPRKEKN